MSKVSIAILILCLFATANSHAQESSNGKKTNTDPTKAGKLDIVDFENNIRPMLLKYCADCHAPGEMEGLDFLAVSTAEDLIQHRALFASVAEQLENRAMPPRDFAQPTDTERSRVVDWIKRSLDLKPSDTDRIAPYVVEAIEDKKGNLWFGTVNRGVARYDGERLTYFSTNDGLPANTVSSVVEDKNGDLWFGTHAGACKFDGKKFIKQGETEGLPTASRPSVIASASVNVDNEGNVWVGQRTHVFRFDGKSFVKFEVPVDKTKITSYGILAGGISLSLQDSKGNLWFRTDGAGAFKFDGNSFTQFTKKDGLCSNCITGIMEDQSGNIWFTCMQSYQPKMTGDGGVCRFDGNEFTQFPEVEGLSQNDIYTIYETRDGKIWIGASGVGAYCYDGSTFTLYDKTDKKHWTRNFGVQSILQDRKGTLWFGFSGGLFRFNGTSFFNVGKNGPWKDVVSAMIDVTDGKERFVDWFHPDANAGLAALAKGDFVLAKTTFLKLKQAAPNEATIQEFRMNQLGYHFFFANQQDLAIEIFKINTELYPNASNTFDSLAEAYLRRGNENLAIKHYEQSLKLNPANTNASEALITIAERRRYEKALVAPEPWLEEVLLVPTSFAPKMTLKGVEHLRLPPEFRKADSDWFITYLFAIELTESAKLSDQLIRDELLTYFRGLASGAADKNGKRIDTDKFEIVSQERSDDQLETEFNYVLTWQEPFTNATHLKQNLRVKVIAGKNQHGIIFVCGSPQPFESAVWETLLQVRDKFEASSLPSAKRHP